MRIELSRRGTDKMTAGNTTAGNTKGLLQWALVVVAAMAVFVGCEGTTGGTTDPGESTQTPTQDLIVFNRDRVNVGVWRMYSNGTGQKALTAPPGENASDEDPVLSPDGSQVAFERSGDIWIVNNDGTELRNVSAGYTALSGASSESEISWSPDVSTPTIAFSRSATPQKYTDIYALEIASVGEEDPDDLFPVTDTAQVADGTATWSPDGSEIVFISRRKNNAGTSPSNNWDLFRTDAYAEGDTSVVRRLTKTSKKNEVFPSWAPDDGDENTPEWIAYHTQEGPKVVVRQIEGGAVGSTFPGERPAWSTDGTQLAFSQDDEIVKVPIDTGTGMYGTATDLTANKDVDTAASWGVVRSIVRAKGASLTEGAKIPGASTSYLEFKVELSAPSSETITVPYEVFEDDATEGEDYDGSEDPLSGSVQFDPGMTQRVVKIAVIDDSQDEPEEGLDLELDTPTGNALLGLDYATGVIKDNDAAPVVEFADVTVGEAAGQATFDIDLQGSSGWPIKLNYDHLVGGGTTATPGTDYTRATGSVTFQPGQTHKEIAVPILDDAIEESDETFKMMLTREVSARSSFEPDGSPGVATGTITDDDGTPAPPGDEEIAFVRFGSSGASDIWTIPAEGGDETQFAFGPAMSGYDYEPNWGEGENSHLLYFSGYNDEDPDIYVRNVNTGDVEKVIETDGPDGTFSQEDEYYPAVSPDGTKLAYSSSFNYHGTNPPDGDFGEGEIYVFDLTQPESSTNPIQLTDNDVEDSSPAWSPDGSTIAYAHGNHGSRDLYQVASDGSSAPEQLTSESGNESFPDWSADGGTIAFSSDQDGDDDIYFLRNVGDTNDIEQVTFDSTSQFDPSFSPDGQALAYSRDGDIVILDIEVCHEDVLTSGLDDDGSPDWKNPGDVDPFDVPETGCVDDGGGGGGGEPINGDIAYISKTDDLSDDGDVFSMDADGQNQENVTNTLVAEGDVAWNGDGTKVAFTRGSDLYVRDTTTGDEEEVAPWMEGSFLSPTWHPTENVLAFTNIGDALGDSENDYDIYVFDFADNSLANVMDFGDTADDLDPAWSPDGSQLAFVSDRSAGSPTTDLFTMDISYQDFGGFFSWVGENVQRRTSLEMDAYEPAWSPEGDVIAFHGMETVDMDDLGAEIYFLHTADDSLSQVTDTASDPQVDDLDPVFSPDGQTLMYSSDADGDPEIYTLDLSDCTTTTKLTTNGAWDTNPAWRPDGSVVSDVVPDCGTPLDGTGALDPADADIVYSKSEAAEWNLWIMTEDGSQQSLLADIEGNETQPVWSPDGTMVAYVGDDGMGGDQHIFVLDTTAPLDGSNPTQVSTEPTWMGQPTWTPEGRVAWVGQDPVDFDFDVYAADFDGANEGVLVNTEFDETYPQFIDDGGVMKMLFLTSSLEGADDDSDTFGDFDTEVWIMEADGSGTPEQVTHHVNRLKEHLKVSPDGVYVTYSDDNGDVWITDIGTGTDTQQTTGAVYENQPAWSADGSELVYVNFDSAGDIYKMPVDDEASAEPLTSDGGQEFSPHWKPEPPPEPVDEPEIAFSSGGFDGSRNVWAVNSDGSSAGVLTDLAGYETQVAWSPDGSMVAFVSDADGDSEIYVYDTLIEVDLGVNPYKLTNNAVTNEWPAWSPDGEVIVYSEGSGNNEELYYESYDDSATPTRITTNSVRDRMATFAPDDGDDGTPFEIAYISERDHAAGEIYRQTLDQDASTATRLTTNTQYDTTPAWSPLGDELAFVREDAGADTEVWTMDPDVADGGAKVTDNSHPDSQPAWSPDGDALVFSSSDGADRDLFIVDLFAPAEMNWDQLTDNDVDDEYPTWRESWDM